MKHTLSEHRLVYFGPSPEMSDAAVRREIPDTDRDRNDRRTESSDSGVKLENANDVDSAASRLIGRMENDLGNRTQRLQDIDQRVRAMQTAVSPAQSLEQRQQELNTTDYIVEGAKAAVPGAILTNDASTRAVPREAVDAPTSKPR
jgi:hypothetical protein